MSTLVIRDDWNPNKVWIVEYNQASEHYHVSQEVGGCVTGKRRRYAKHRIEEVLGITIKPGCTGYTKTEQRLKAIAQQAQRERLINEFTH